MGKNCSSNQKVRKQKHTYIFFARLNVGKSPAAFEINIKTEEKVNVS